MLIWFNVVFTGLILLFTVAVIGEKEKGAKNTYQSILMLSIFCFFLLNFFKWFYL